LGKSGGFGISASARTASTSTSAISVTTHVADCIPKDICSTRSGRSSCSHPTPVRRHLTVREIYSHNSDRDAESGSTAASLLYLRFHQRTKKKIEPQAVPGPSITVACFRFREF